MPSRSGPLVGIWRPLKASGRFLFRWWGPTSCCLVVIIGMLVPAACATRHHDLGVGGESPPPYDGTATAPAGIPPSEAPPRLPGPLLVPARLDSEPTIGVFLRSGTRLRFTTEVAGSAGTLAIEAGEHEVEAGGHGLLLDGQPVERVCAISLAERPGQARFSADVQPPHGPSQHLRLLGSPLLCQVGPAVELIERIPLEDYLAGVVTSEMSSSWPQAALEAQAVAARSYACAKILERTGAPWQLHWHYTVDMAYAGAGAHQSPASRAALAATRGWILESQGYPLPALFHACSGGRTESAAHLQGGMAAAMAATMPVVADPAAEPGALGLGKSATHWHWQATVTLEQIREGLAAWSAEHPERRLPAGRVLAVGVGSRFKDSGRVSQVVISERLGQKVKSLTLPAQDFRLAVGPGIIRSTWWDRCVMLSAGSGALLVAGRGFGHGVGLSQVSAWELAREGETSQSILGRFYVGATLVHRYP